MVLILLELLGLFLDRLAHGFGASSRGFDLLLPGRLSAFRLRTTGDCFAASSFPLSALGTSIKGLGDFLFLYANVFFGLSKTVLDSAWGGIVMLLGE